MTVLMSAALASLTLSVVLLAFGLRGRRVDDHPLCRRCGFDQTGRPATSAQCAECGADLTRRRAIRVGHRVRRRGALALGTILLLAAVVPTGIAGWGRAKSVDWNRHKPGWWLVSEAKGRDAAARDAALAELLRRIGARTLSDGNVAALVVHALAEQGDPVKPWLPKWGEAVEQARDAGNVPDEQWARYLRQALGPEALRLDLGPEMPDGMRDISVRRDTFRLGRGRPELIAFVWLPNLRDWAADVPDWDEVRPNRVQMHGSVLGWSRSDTKWDARGSGGRPLPQGHTVTVPLKVRVYEVPAPTIPQFSQLREMPEPDAAYLRAEAVLKVTGTLPPGPDAQPAPSPALAPPPASPGSATTRSAS